MPAGASTGFTPSASNRVGSDVLREKAGRLPTAPLRGCFTPAATPVLSSVMLDVSAFQGGGHLEADPYPAESGFRLVIVLRGNPTRSGEKSLQNAVGDGGVAGFSQRERAESGML